MQISWLKKKHIIKLSKKTKYSSPVRYWPKGEVQVQSGEPTLRENTHSKCTVDPGKTTISPFGSIDADPEGIFINMDGGESSKKRLGFVILI